MWIIFYSACKKARGIRWEDISKHQWSKFSECFMPQWAKLNHQCECLGVFSVLVSEKLHAVSFFFFFSVSGSNSCPCCYQVSANAGELNSQPPCCILPLLGLLCLPEGKPQVLS